MAGSDFIKKGLAAVDFITREMAAAEYINRGFAALDFINRGLKPTCLSMILCSFRDFLPSPKVASAF